MKYIQTTGQIVVNGEKLSNPLIQVLSYGLCQSETLGSEKIITLRNQLAYYDLDLNLLTQDSCYEENPTININIDMDKCIDYLAGKLNGTIVEIETQIIENNE